MNVGYSKNLTEYRIRGIEKAEIEYYENLTRTLDKIEDEVVALADKTLPREAFILKVQ